MTADEIRAIPLFENVPRRRRANVARLFDRVTLPTGKIVTQEGDFAHELFLIIDGSADVIRDGQHVAVLGPGDFFGEIGLVTDRRMATVTATSSLDVAAITRSGFRTLARYSPDVASTVLSTGNQRVVTALRQTQETPFTGGVRARPRFSGSLDTEPA